MYSSVCAAVLAKREPSENMVPRKTSDGSARSSSAFIGWTSGFVADAPVGMKAGIVAEYEDGTECMELD